MSKSKKILITGGDGYIARRLQATLAEQYDITSVGRGDFDLTDFDKVAKYFKGRYFDVVIHCAIVGGNRLEADTADDLYANLLMYYNLMANRKHFKRLIQFGSGAELIIPPSYYGMSKFVTANLFKKQPNYLNLRLFAVFDEDELPTRFIKSNILRYINKQPLVVHQDKLMDFFYMQDLISLIKYHLDYDRDWVFSEIDCKYLKSHKLSEVAAMINNLADYKVDLEIGEGSEPPYVGVYGGLPINLIGLEQGIINVYNKLK